MAKVPNAIEILPKIWTACVGRTSVTDDRRQTDGRAIAYSEREGEFTFAKNTTLLHVGPTPCANWNGAKIQIRLNTI